MRASTKKPKPPQSAAPPIKIRRSKIEPAKPVVKVEPVKPPIKIKTPKAKVEVPPKVKDPASAPPSKLCQVNSPQRIRAGGSKKRRRIPAVDIANKLWGSPFRVREIDGRWHAAWVGSDMGLDTFAPADWADAPCVDRNEAAVKCLAAFEVWVASHPEIVAGSRPR
jgi:hypothetical protein